jgi:hypothetical protein
MHAAARFRGVRHDFLSERQVRLLGPPRPLISLLAFQKVRVEELNLEARRILLVLLER